MGLLDQVVGAISGNAEGSGESSVLSSVLHLVNNPETGGLSGLIGAFQQGGLGEVVQSWISTGQNQPIAPDQLESVLGSNVVSEIAGKLGIDPQQASGQLAELLPQVIDKLTPDGQVPEGGNLAEQGLALLKGKLFG